MRLRVEHHHHLSAEGVGGGLRGEGVSGMEDWRVTGGWMESRAERG